MKKVSLLLVLSMLMSLLSFGGVNASADETESALNTADTSWYDEEDNIFKLSDAADLLGLQSLVNGGKTFSGKTIELANDIDMSGVTDFTGIGYWEWTSTDSGKAFSGTFDGDGHAIKNITISKMTDGTTATQCVGVAMFGLLNGATIKNLGVRDLSLYFPHSDNVSYKHYDIGGLVSHSTGNTTIDNCYINGLKMEFGNAVRGFGQVGAIIGKTHGSGTLTISNTYVANFKKFQIMDNGASVTLGSFVGAPQSGTTLNITDCYAGPIESVVIAKASGSTNFYDAGTAYGTKNIKNFYYVPWEKNISITNNEDQAKRTDTTLTGAVSVTESELLGLNAEAMAPAFKNKFMSDHRNVNGGYPILVSRAKENSPFAKGSGTKDDPYLISSESEFRDFAKAVNNGIDYAGKKVQLTKDMDLNNVPWTPIGYVDNNENDTMAFKGVFDGDGHTVSNVKITRESATVDSVRKSLGFFGGLGGNALLQKFGLKNVSIDLTVGAYNNDITSIGCLVGQTCTGTKNESIVTNSSIQVNNCFVENSSIKLGLNGESGSGNSYGNVGALIGYTSKEKSAVVYNCYSRDFLVDSTSGKSQFSVAGFIGAVNDGSVEVSKSYCTGVTVNFEGGKEPNSTYSMIGGWNISTDKSKDLYTTQSLSATNKGSVTVVTESDLKAMTDDCTALASVFDTSKYGLNGGYPIIKSLKIFDYDVNGDSAVLSVKGTFTNEKLILALYNKDTGRYVNSVVANPSEGALSATMDLSKIKTGDYTVKGFLWTADNAPLENVYENTLTK